MVDSREKGARAERNLRDVLRKATGQAWERIPGSGAYGVSHQLKGDVYLPCPTTGINRSKYCIEVKHYKDDVITSLLLKTTSQHLKSFWEQTLRESEELSKKPMLVFKKDRGRWLCGLESAVKGLLPELTYTFLENSTMHIYDLEALLKTEFIGELYE